jgi:hypothetical protein
MATTLQLKARHSACSHYFSAKISDHCFRRVLLHYALDNTVQEAARDTQLSATSVNAIFGKLRRFFSEAGLFEDYSMARGSSEARQVHARQEKALLEFHNQRLRRKRGLRHAPDSPDYHFAESCWRYDFHVLMDERLSDQLQAMMFAHLLEIVRLCGPVGRPPVNRAAALRAVLRHIDERAQWRNEPGFSTPKFRAALRELRAYFASI